MNAHAVRTLIQRKNLALAVVVLLSSVVVMFGVAASIARSQNAVATSSDEREIENTVPEHVPVKVKVKNEQSLKDLKNKNWARELELEVKNTGSKPIYYVHISILMPEIIINRGTLALNMSYGRNKLKFPDEPVLPDDVPILPGETITLKIPEGQVKAYEGFRDEDKMFSDPKRIEIEVNAVNLDDTYFMGRKGELMPRVPKKKSANEARPRGDSGNCAPKPGERKRADLRSGFLETIYSSQPASLLRANFSPPLKATGSVIQSGREIIVDT